MSGMEVSAEMIGGSAKEILGTGDSLTSDIAAFRSQVEALTGAFGGDELGSALGTIYQIVSEAAFESFEDNADGLAEIGHNLQGMADDYSAVETANQGTFQQLLGEQA
ncbi:WXG100 family type VII secretion target [Lentzea sp. NPDC058436]|uniref:WXG100 family type VII secretion target n=1 Tax=Lentzea sp. NPDC058436 TaxID=3346499 RepID=UPI00364FE95F